MSIEGAVMMYAIAALGINGSDPDDTDPAIAKRAAALLREWQTDPRVKDTPHRFLPVGVLVRLALVAGDGGLAQTLLDDAARRSPHDGGLAFGRAFLFADQGGWEAARLNAMMVLENNPDQPHMLRIYRQSTEKLQQLGKAGYLPPARNPEYFPILSEPAEPDRCLRRVPRFGSRESDPQKSAGIWRKTCPPRSNIRYKHGPDATAGQTFWPQPRLTFVDTLNPFSLLRSMS
jgi:hypothetical protein